MPESVQPTVLLLSSDVRRRYAEDILTALALPSGALVGLRYDAEYVASALQQRIADHSIIHEQCLIGFVSSNDSIDTSDTNSSRCFFLPVRLAELVSAEAVADFFVLRLRVHRYPNLDDWPLMKSSELFSEGGKFIDRLIEANGEYRLATTRFPDPRVNDDGDQGQLWLGVVRRLSSHPTFANAYFLRVEPSRFKRTHKPVFDHAGRLSLTDRQSVRLRTTIYSRAYSDTNRTVLSCWTDGRFLRVSSDDKHDVALRHDSVEFWLQPSAANFDALAHVTLSLGVTDPDVTGHVSLTTHVHLPVFVRRSGSTLLLRVMSSSIGAFLIALPAILGPGFSVRWRILPAVLGAVLIAFAAIVIPWQGSQ